MKRGGEAGRLLWLYRVGLALSRQRLYGTITPGRLCKWWCYWVNWIRYANDVRLRRYIVPQIWYVETIYFGRVLPLPGVLPDQWVRVWRPFLYSRLPANTRPRVLFDKFALPNRSGLLVDADSGWIFSESWDRYWDLERNDLRIRLIVRVCRFFSLQSHSNVWSIKRIERVRRAT